MTRFKFALAVTVLLAGASVRAQQPTAPSVTPVSAPIPLVGAAPMAPPLLRSQNPSVLAMTGTWRFSLTHGAVVAGGVFVPGETRITASSTEAGHPASDAFDGNPETRWCASGASLPQSLRVDLGAALVVNRVDLTWEKRDDIYRFRIEGSSDDRNWADLGAHLDSPSPNSADGAYSLAQAAPVRYLRVVVTGVSGPEEGAWASIRECRIHVASADRTTTLWKPTAPKAPSDAERDAFAASTFGDTGWDKITVPSNWEMLGYSVPTYNAVDDTVGLYRRTVDVPASFAGKRVLWRFDGVLDGAEIWVNGKRAGYHESGYTAFDIDLTDFVKPGEPNQFAVRVSKTTPSDDCETGDFQCMGGIYRDNYLIALPKTHVENLSVTTKLDTDYRDATLGASLDIVGVPGEQISIGGALTRSESTPRERGVPNFASLPLPVLQGRATVGPDGRAHVALSSLVSKPLLWSAEKPNLYYLILTISRPGETATERVEQRFGFKQIDIKNGVVLWNGVPIKCTGVCRHDFWADKGFALTEVEWRKDLELMRGANINAIRTSHYNHAERFLEMCDEMGFYILDEVPFCWIGDKFSDPAFTPYLIQRANETIARDRNRPCVLAWSIGNENGPGKDGQALVDRVTELDPTRPCFVSGEGPRTYKGQQFRDNHYPSPASIAYLASPEDGVLSPANLSENPHTFYEKEAQDYDPGISDLWGDALQKVWDLIRPQPTVLGSFIWEWQNQGVADQFPDKTIDFWYGPDHLRQENNKGIVDAYRHPKAEWAYVRMVYSPIGIDTNRIVPAGKKIGVPLENRYSFTNLDELTCRWTTFNQRLPLAHGTSRIACVPGQSVLATFPQAAQMTRLRLEFLRADGSSVIDADLPLTNAAFTRPAPPVLSSGKFAAFETPNSLTVSRGDHFAVTFDRKSGSLKSWSAGGRVLLTGGPIVNLGEARVRGDEAPKDYLYGPEPPAVENGQLTWKKLADSVEVTSIGQVRGAGAGHPNWGRLFVTYLIRASGIVDVSWKIYWNENEAHAWEAGLKFVLAKDMTHMLWARTSQFNGYPIGHQGMPEGGCASSDVSFRSSKRDLHYLALIAPSGAGLVLAENGGPLIGRAISGADGVVLCASSAVAGARGLSYSWVADDDITLTRDASVGGQFRLYPTVPVQKP